MQSAFPVVYWLNPGRPRGPERLRLYIPSSRKGITMNAKTIRSTLLAVLLIAAASGQDALLCGAGAAEASGPSDPPANGLAADYPRDAGIEKNAAVVFVDTFEDWRDDGTQPPPDSWDGIRRNDTSRTRAIPGNVLIDGREGPGEHILEIACWHAPDRSQTGGLSLKLGNYNNANEGLGEGYDELHVRHYIRFDEDYRGVRNHGSNLGGRDLTMGNPAWVGMAGIRDVASRGYFYSGLQPYAERGSREFEMGFYSYHIDKPGPWGDRYEVQNPIPVDAGKWYCVERHMKLNSVDPATGEARKDGVEELWVDGRLSIRREALRFRKSPSLKITLYTLETYYHGLPEEFGRSNPIQVHYDNVVIARDYIGPMRLSE